MSATASAAKTSAKTPAKRKAPKRKASPRKTTTQSFLKRAFSVKTLRAVTKTALAAIIPLFAMTCGLFALHLFSLDSGFGVVFGGLRLDFGCHGAVRVDSAPGLLNRRAFEEQQATELRSGRSHRRRHPAG